MQPLANHELSEDFAPGDYPGDDVSELERGERDFAGTPFRVGEKLIEVAGRFIPDPPGRVDGIRVDKRAKNIYFFQGARWGAFGKQGDAAGHWVADGTPIGYYIVNCADRDSITDDFSGNYGSKWSIINPNPQNVSIKKWPGMLTITTERGGIWKGFHDAKNIFVLDKLISKDGDFVMTTRIVGLDPQENYNQAGLICLSDTDNYIKYVWQWDDNQNGRCISSIREVQGGNISSHPLRLDNALDDVWLRMIKHRNRYICAASTDGEHHRITGKEAWPATPLLKVGLIDKNGASPTAPALEASFDFFTIEPLEKASALLFTSTIEAEAVPTSTRRAIATPPSACRFRLKVCAYKFLFATQIEAIADEGRLAKQLRLPCGFVFEQVEARYDLEMISGCVHEQ